MGHACAGARVVHREGMGGMGAVVCPKCSQRCVVRALHCDGTRGCPAVQGGWRALPLGNECFQVNAFYYFLQSFYFPGLKP